MTRHSIGREPPYTCVRRGAPLRINRHYAQIYRCCPLLLAASAALTYPRPHPMDQRSPETARVTELLIAASNGQREALDELVPLVYHDLRRLAAAHVRREPPGHSVQATALVHETYLRLVDQRQARWLSRAH